MSQHSEKLAHHQKGPLLDTLVTVGGIVQGLDLDLPFGGLHKTTGLLVR